MTSLQKQTCSLTFLLLGFFLILISCNNDDASDQEIDKVEVSDIEFTSDDISYNLLNLKWNAVTGPNNEKVVYEVFIGDTKLTDDNEDTDYIINRS